MSVSANALAQYKPAGLSGSNLKLWLDGADPSAISFSSGSSIKSFDDKAGGYPGLSLAQSSTAAQPAYIPSGINGLPSISFDGSNHQQLQLQSSSGLASSYFQNYSTFSQLTVFQPASASTGFLLGKPQVWAVNIAGGSGQRFYASADGVSYNDSIVSANGVPINSPALFSSVYTASGLFQAFNLGAALGSVPAGPSSLGANTAVFSLGADLGGATPFTGNIGEVLIYDKALLASERIILENYLAAKWSLGLTANALYQAPQPGSWGTNLTGIGRSGPSDMVTATASSDGLGFASGSGAADFLGTNGFLLAAHNGQAATIIGPANIPLIGPSVDRWNRAWYLSANGGNPSGNCVVSFDFSAYNNSSVPPAYAYFWVFNPTDPTFSGNGNKIIAATTTPGATTVTFNVLGSAMSKGYYTLMWWAAAPGITIAPATVCAGATITLTGVPIDGASYQWMVNTGSGFVNVGAADPGGATYSGANTPTLTISGATTSLDGYLYKLVVTLPGGVNLDEGTGSVSVAPAPPAKSLIASAASVCQNDSVVLSINAPDRSVEYNIYTDSTLDNLVAQLDAGANSVKLAVPSTTTFFEQGVNTSTGCIQTDSARSVTVTVIPPPTQKHLAATPDTICSGSSTILSIPGADAGVNYLVFSDSHLTIPSGTITSSSNSLTVQPNASVTYYMQAVSQGSGCRQPALDSLPVVVLADPIAQPLLSDNDTICSGSPVTLSIGSPEIGVLYHIYSDINLTAQVGLLSAASNALTLYPAVSAIYYEQAVNSTSGCVQTSPILFKSVIVQNTPSPAPLLASTAILCTGDSVILSIQAPQPGVDYRIYSDPGLSTLIATLRLGADSLKFAPTATNTYYELAANAASGCVQAASPQSVTVSVNPAPLAGIITSPSTSICKGSSTTLGIAAPQPNVVYNIYSDPTLTTLVGSLNAASNSLLVTPLQSTTYYAQAVQQSTGCVQAVPPSNLLITVVIPPIGKPMTASAPILCSGSSTTLSISAPDPSLNYNIYSDAALSSLVGTLSATNNSLIVSPAATTTYYEQAVDPSSGCTQTGPSQSLTITITPTPSAQPFGMASLTVCSGSGVPLSIANPAPGVVYFIYSDAALTNFVGKLSSASNSLTVFPSVTTTYYENAVFTSSGCSQTDPPATVTITVAAAPAAKSIGATSIPVCAGSTTYISIINPDPGVNYNIYSDPAFS